MSASSVDTVSRHMRKDIASVSPEVDAYDAISLLLANHISALPVITGDGNLVGILSERVCLEAFISAEYYESPPQLVRDLMTEDVVSVAHDTDIMKVAAMFSEKKFHHFPVLSNGRLVGQISRRGVIRALEKIRRAG